MKRVSVRSISWVDCCKALIATLASLFLASCSSTTQKLVTYHVEFMADGSAYNVVTKYMWYHTERFANDSYRANYATSQIRGTLKDGSQYEIIPSGYAFYESGHTDVQSVIYIRTTRNIAESFDETHDHSPSHTVHITKSYVDITDAGGASDSVAESANKDYLLVQKSYRVYQAVGAKVTPFSNVEEAKKSFINSGTPTIPPPLGYKNAAFNFHPIDAVLANSEADMTYDGQSFHAAFPRSREASIWVLDPDVGVEGEYTTGHHLDINVSFGGKNIFVDPIMRSFYLDPISQKVIIFFKDEAVLGFGDQGGVEQAR